MRGYLPKLLENHTCRLIAQCYEVCQIHVLSISFFITLSLSLSLSLSSLSLSLSVCLAMSLCSEEAAETALEVEAVAEAIAEGEAISDAIVEGEVISDAIAEGEAEVSIESGETRPKSGSVRQEASLGDVSSGGEMSPPLDAPSSVSCGHRFSMDIFAKWRLAAYDLEFISCVITL